MRTVFRRLGKIFNGTRETPAFTEQASAVSDSIFDSYSFVIGSLFSYFNDLPPEGKKHFVQRVHHFKSSKKSHFIGTESNTDAAILVNSWHVQVTFVLIN